MQILNIVPKEIFINFELSVEEVQDLLVCLDNCEVAFDMNNPKNQKTFETFKHFNDMLEALDKDLRGSDA